MIVAGFVAGKSIESATLYSFGVRPSPRVQLRSGPSNVLFNSPLPNFKATKISILGAHLGSTLPEVELVWGAANSKIFTDTSSSFSYIKGHPKWMGTLKYCPEKKVVCELEVLNNSYYVLVH